MGGGGDSFHPLMASLFCVKTFVEYGANLVSYFDPVYSYFGEGSFYYYFRIDRLRLIKNLTPLWVSPVRKRVWAFLNVSLTKARL
jgi:hypothetical protein